MSAEKPNRRQTRSVACVNAAAAARLWKATARSVLCPTSSGSGRPCGLPEAPGRGAPNTAVMAPVAGGENMAASKSDARQRFNADGPKPVATNVGGGLDKSSFTRSLIKQVKGNVSSVIKPNVRESSPARFEGECSGTDVSAFVGNAMAGSTDGQDFRTGWVCVGGDFRGVRLVFTVACSNASIAESAPMLSESSCLVRSKRAVDSGGRMRTSAGCDDGRATVAATVSVLPCDDRPSPSNRVAPKPSGREAGQTRPIAERPRTRTRCRGSRPPSTDVEACCWLGASRRPDEAMVLIVLAASMKPFDLALPACTKGIECECANGSTGVAAPDLGVTAPPGLAVGVTAPPGLAASFPVSVGAALCCGHAAGVGVAAPDLASE
mmetsp:Transcript_8199/g.23414  ORF Transcript_8199/g.23414 Transcript_8199/m.23414 type:complete len:380 (+) Transcript_8199:817-1956(+)